MDKVVKYLDGTLPAPELSPTHMSYSMMKLMLDNGSCILTGIPTVYLVLGLQRSVRGWRRREALLDRVGHGGGLAFLEESLARL
ncbi:hypothetical protein E2562_008918 [Oryza meyeriana var. granulata]|uniref:Uncharacterized protein n=1 Tax=Oryza meyeriana var. granulata TaxID=110450 RepID=A0A6G1D0K2_9ORYZ|nr:hypothetical protein E2562_008918 [Oryza meyeriana var. granulata]